MAQRDLKAQARDFAAEISELLNGTVTQGIRLGAVVAVGGTTLVGRGITVRNFTPETIPLCIGGRQPRLWLRVAFILSLDDEGQYLTVTKSDYSICLDEDGANVLAHYDYDRAPVNEYPSAHLQVNGANEGLADLFSQTDNAGKLLGHLHFPVGGKRFRPTLEDVVEFLIVEGLLDGHDGWEAQVADHRQRWEELQLRAAVRRDPEAARAQLTAMGYAVTPPPEKPKRRGKR